jgi:hypothetical protein
MQLPRMRIRRLGRGSVKPRPHRPKLRLWVISLLLFAGGFAGRVATNAWIDNIAYSYPLEVGIHFLAYGAGLAVWGSWWALQAQPDRRGLGCLLGLVLAAAAFITILSSVPKRGSIRRCSGLGPTPNSQQWIIIGARSRAGNDAKSKDE